MLHLIPVSFHKRRSISDLNLKLVRLQSTTTMTGPVLRILQRLACQRPSRAFCSRSGSDQSTLPTKHEDTPKKVVGQKYSSPDLAQPSGKAQPPEPFSFSTSAAYAPRTDLPPSLRRKMDEPTDGINLTFYESSTFRDTQAFAVFGSLAVFIAYLFLREGNDVDEWIQETWDRPLWQDVPVLEKEVLEKLILEGKYAGKDTSEYQARLREVIQEMEDWQLSYYRGAVMKRDGN